MMSSMDKMESTYTVYIDESGDLGIKRGLRWFVMTATIVKKSDEPEIRNTLNSIRKEYNLRQIHLKEIRNFYKTARIVNEVSTHEFTIISVLIDTDKWKTKDSIYSYNYACRILLERASWFLKEKDSYADVVLSSRGTSRDKELIEYVDKLSEIKDSEVKNRFNIIKCKTPMEWEMLQLADVCATSVARAYQINDYGFITPCFATVLKDKLYKYKGTVDGYGMKFLSNDMKPAAEYFNGHLICRK